jgi:hypothetical protein
MVYRLDWSACQALEENFIGIKTSSCFGICFQRYSIMKRKQLSILKDLALLENGVYVV